ncbi:MAG: serine protease, partial [Gemmatales bacterium]|nr:serine protease [Gemmatales bacterium]
KSVPLLIGEDAHGSGFIIEITRKKSKRWFIVTNKHVIEELQEAMGEQKEPTLPYRPKWNVIFFVKPDGRTLYVSPSDELFVRYIHRDADVALIECTGLINQLEDRGIRPLRLAPREHIVRPGMELVVIGHPGLAGIDKPVPMTYTKGQIAGPEREINGLRYYQLQVPAAPGNSGGPVLDMTGQVIAIVTMRVRDNNQGQFNFALHLKYLYQLLDEVP